jgi:hypothetical protein
MHYLTVGAGRHKKTIIRSSRFNNSCTNVDGKSLLEIGLSRVKHTSSAAKTQAGKSRSPALFGKNHLQKRRRTG